MFPVVRLEDLLPDDEQNECQIGEQLREWEEMEAFQNGNCLSACSSLVALRRVSFVDAFCALECGVKVS